MVAGATASTRQKLSVLTSSSSDMSSDNTAAVGHRTTDHPSQNAASAIKEAGNLCHIHNLLTRIFIMPRKYEQNFLSM